jgi:hypothetical protein
MNVGKVSKKIREKFAVNEKSATFALAFPKQT